jgi:hypothetical protein
MTKEQLFEQILVEFVHPCVDANDEQFEMGEVVDSEQRLVEEFLNGKNKRHNDQ